MTNQHPITVPIGSITFWKISYRATCQEDISETEYIATQAAQWGADQELEACCEWIVQNCGKLHWWEIPVSLRASRRPKPPSLKEQALALINSNKPYLDDTAMDTIRKALEQLND
jgi:hypothetical protein